MSLAFTAISKVFSRRSRRLMGFATLVASAGKVAVVVTASRLAAGEPKTAVVLATSAGVLFAVQRAITSSLRVSAEADALRGLSKALLEGDVLADPEPNAQTTMGEGVAELPPLAEAAVVASSGAIAFVFSLWFLVPILPIRLIGAALAALGVVVAVTLGLRQTVARRQAEVLVRQRRVYDEALHVLHGRLEIVARGGETRTLASLDRALDEYRRVAERTAGSSAVLGRAPMVAGAITVVAIVFATAGAHIAARALVGHALLLASAMAPLVGAFLAANDVIRRLARLRSFFTLLAMPARFELGQLSASRPVSMEARDVAFSYDSSGPVVLDALDLRWHSGEPLVIAGRNGSGKSTLLKLLVGLRPPLRGVIEASGMSLDAIELAAFRADVAYLPQRPYLGETHTTIREAIALAVDGADDLAVEAALARVGLAAGLHGRGDLLAVHVGELSAGQCQRLALARILLAPARLVLLDEPDANLDRPGVQLLERVVRELVAKGVMVAIAAHDPELLALASMRVDLSARSR